jgi:hypothetical protein
MGPVPKDVDVIPGATSTLRRRLYAKVLRTRRHECWRWSGKHAKKRDGALRPAIMVGRRGSRTMTVARVLLALRDRVSLDLRTELEAGHTCGHHWCINVRHLVWQTRWENEAMKSEHRRWREFSQAVDELAETAEAA